MWHTQCMSYTKCRAALCSGSLVSTGSVLGCTSELSTGGPSSSRHDTYIAPGHVMQRGQVRTTWSSHISLLCVTRTFITELTHHRETHSNSRQQLFMAWAISFTPLAVVVRVQHLSTSGSSLLESLAQNQNSHEKVMPPVTIKDARAVKGLLCVVLGLIFLLHFPFFHYKASLLQPVYPL